MVLRPSIRPPLTASRAGHEQQRATPKARRRPLRPSTERWFPPPPDKQRRKTVRQLSMTTSTRDSRVLGTGCLLNTVSARVREHLFNTNTRLLSAALWCTSLHKFRPLKRLRLPQVSSYAEVEPIFFFVNSVTIEWYRLLHCTNRFTPHTDDDLPICVQIDCLDPAVPL